VRAADPATATTVKEHIMSTNKTNTKLALRAHSIRNLTAAELRVVHGGDSVEVHGRCNVASCAASDRSA
jgi:hypothetical protein